MASQPKRSAEIKLGLDILYEPNDTENAVDIVAVHGLGANPEKSWQYDPGTGQVFDWLQDREGLPNDSPDSRIMRFAYGSAYQGQFKMKQYIGNIAAGLLNHLNLKRNDCSRRPIVLIGHSMGGIVIAKALCLAEREPTRYPGIFESIAGCLFFGTPFNGAPVAEIAHYWAKLNEGSGVAVNSQLLDLLKPDNESLRDLKRDFVKACNKLAQKVELFCFYEQQETSWDRVISKLANQEFPPELIARLDTKESRQFVTRESASLDGSNEMGLVKPHRELVMFKGIKDPEYQALCKQQEVLATYAKLFVRMGKGEGNSRKPQLSVENLWQCLRDMLTENSIGTVHFVINNLHNLPENSASTKTLIDLIGKDVRDEVPEKGKRVSTKWLFTSRSRDLIRECMESNPLIHSINLEDEKYGKTLKLELKQHAWDRVNDLQRNKGYNKAIAYFAGSVIGNRAEQSKWIDVAVVQLAALPAGADDIRIRNMLERVPQDFTALLDDAWTFVLRSSAQDLGSIKELLRALIITYEDPTEDELLVLTGLHPDNEKHKAYLRALIDKCKPLLCLKKLGKTNKIAFVNADVKSHLLGKSKNLLGLSNDDIRLQHGILALRCFSHILERLSAAPGGSTGKDASGLRTADNDNEKRPPPSPRMLFSAQVSDAGDAQGGFIDGVSLAAEGEELSEDDDSSDDDSDDDESDYDDSDGHIVDETSEKKGPLRALRYATVYWIRHASEATPDVAERLCLEDAFWSPQSKIRVQWCDEFERSTHTFELRDLDITGLNALHIASTIGFPHLVECLISSGHKTEMHEYDALENQPLHLAAAFGNMEIVELLLRQGARLDDAGPQGLSCTPLAMAASSGQIDLMQKLIHMGANKDAVASSIGPVINGAIISGVTEAVRLLINMGVKLSYDYEEPDETQVEENDGDDGVVVAILPPLALAALISDISLFSTVLEAGQSSLTAEEHAKALCMASVSGRIEVVEKLLDYVDELEVLQGCLQIATGEHNWDVVHLLLQKGGGLDCRELFKCAAEGSESLELILRECWDYTNESLPQELLDSCLYTATDFEKEETVKVLLEFGADPDAQGAEFGNALTASANDGTVAIARALLQAGADVNSPHGYALQAAAGRGHINMVELLVSHGAYIDSFSNRHEAGTALQAACNNGHCHVAAFLLNNGANPNLGSGSYMRPIIAAVLQRDTTDELLCQLLQCDGLDLDFCGGPLNAPPTHYAALCRPADDMRKLIQAGAPVDKVDGDGFTALMAAAGYGKPDTVKVLLDQNADFTIPNMLGLTALDLAVQLGHTECKECG
ncbi:hypothetical protein ONZ43_g5537 [Nemania bipapillata]|uniref:Uncharacterized protein n=1 Tax=Nemania bipapillata TaxID=110536 RepID=A0ACC2I9I9_9PEZI|nr:hypothetical protein ONZ43_g5537 [Nemania bipapillata]